MDEFLSADVTVLFLFLLLLPGFLGQLVYGYLKQGPPQDKLDRVITAFALSLVTMVCTHLVFRLPLLPQVAVTKDSSASAVLQSMTGMALAWNAAFAVLIALLFAWANSLGLLRRLSQLLRLSNKGSDNDVWKDTFDHYRGYWLKLDYADGTSIVGWPKFYSASDRPRELFIADAMRWIKDENDQLIAVEISGPGLYISDFSSIAISKYLIRSRSWATS